MQNKYPLWKYLVLVVLVVFCFIYAIPNLYGDDPAVQISGLGTTEANQDTVNTVKTVLNKASLSYKSLQVEQNNLLLVRFADPAVQLQAQEYIKAALGDDYTVALNLAPATPRWLQAIGANPMKLGLDLRGGVHFLLYIDANAAIKKRIQDDLKEIGRNLRDAKIRYSQLRVDPNGNVDIAFRSQDAMEAAYSFLTGHYNEFSFEEKKDNDQYHVIGNLSPAALTTERQAIVDQAILVLRNRINELGVSEPSVQQQGQDRVAVDLPGIQDATQAKQIIGGTSTLEFHLVDNTQDPQAIAAGASVPAGSALYTMSTGQPILLYDNIVLKGSSITSATSSFSQETGEPVVNIRISGSGVSYFTRITAENVGNRMGIVLVEMKTDSRLVNGEVKSSSRRIERVISAPRIDAALSNAFQISGLQDAREARDLALQLRAGALPAAVSYLEESTVGPTLGKVNIQKGIHSVEIGFALIVIFMLFYYHVFGLIADIALFLNLVVLLAVLSLLGAVLTLPGIAGILLTIGMAVDANVLIFERIREELRNGVSIQASIYAGYEKAFSTIVDANVTTLIAAVTLFSLGSGAVKGFAITLTIGILTSMITAVTVTRAIVNLLYGRRELKTLSIGINLAKLATRRSRAAEQSTELGRQ
ncbi:MAG: hypothetical protein K0R12_1130 [Gammaproteobacteria bacterium]|nr:hypothetical protein [Gammaproteobacteria bacterium]